MDDADPRDAEAGASGVRQRLHREVAQEAARRQRLRLAVANAERALQNGLRARRRAGGADGVAIAARGQREVGGDGAAVQAEARVARAALALQRAQVGQRRAALRPGVRRRGPADAERDQRHGGGRHQGDRRPLGPAAAGDVGVVPAGPRSPRSASIRAKIMSRFTGRSSELPTRASPAGRNCRSRAEHDAHSVTCCSTAWRSSCGEHAREVARQQLVDVAGGVHASSAASWRNATSMRLLTVPSGVPGALGDLRVAEPAVERELDSGALLFRQGGQRVGHRELVGDPAGERRLRAQPLLAHLGQRQLRPRRGAAEAVDQAVARDHRDPCAHGRALRIVRMRGAPHGHEHLLHQVLGGAPVAGASQHVGVHRRRRSAGGSPRTRAGRPARRRPVARPPRSRRARPPPRRTYCSRSLFRTPIESG